VDVPRVLCVLRRSPPSSVPGSTCSERDREEYRCLLVMLPQLEHSLRRVFVAVNEFAEERLLTAGTPLPAAAAAAALLLIVADALRCSLFSPLFFRRHAQRRLCTTQRSTS
jgi:hypothetical protein